jgi:molecular chaperone GrpE
VSNDKKQANADAMDDAAQAELEGVPASMLDDGDDTEGSELSDDVAALKSDLDALNTDLEAAKQDVLYAKAETQNVRRRLEKDMQDARNFAASGFARDVLSVSDNLARAVDALPDELRDDEKMKGFVAGIEATQRELDKVFGQHGITRIASVGLPLDPNQHQAMIEIPTADEEPGTVVQEMQAGYMIKDRLLRPAMVGVAKRPE